MESLSEIHSSMNRSMSKTLKGELESRGLSPNALEAIFNDKYAIHFKDYENTSAGAMCFVVGVMFGMDINVAVLADPSSKDLVNQILVEHNKDDILRGFDEFLSRTEKKT